MRKAFLFLILFIGVSVGGMCMAFAGINEARDQVEITERVLYGDKSVAEGLKIQCKTGYDNRLFWNTTYEIGEVPTTNTEYEFYASQRPEERTITYAGISLENYVEYGLHFNEESQTGIAGAMKELYDSTAPGEEKSKIIYLKDYMEYYPLQMSHDFHGMRFYFSHEEFADAEHSEYEPGSPVEAYFQFEQFAQNKIFTSLDKKYF